MSYRKRGAEMSVRRVKKRENVKEKEMMKRVGEEERREEKRERK